MKVSEFLEKQTYLNITNSHLKNDTKLNEILLDAIYYSLETIKNKPNMSCNVILLKIPDENNVNIQMSGNSNENTANCYTQLSYVVTDSKQKYTGITMTKESDSYKISIQPSNITQKSTNINTDSKTNTEPQTTTPNNTSSNGDSIKSQLEKIMYTPIQNQIKTTSESIHSDEILLEEIKRIKNIMYI